MHNVEMVEKTCLERSARDPTRVHPFVADKWRSGATWGEREDKVAEEPPDVKFALDWHGQSFDFLLLEGSLGCPAAELIALVIVHLYT